MKLKKCIDKAISGIGYDLKSSKIYVEIKDINISNDKDWIEIVHFHLYECQKIIQFLIIF